MLLVVISSVLVALVLLGVHWLEERIGLGPFFAFVLALQAFECFLGATVSIDLFGRVSASPLSATLTSATLLAVLLIYLTDGLAATRQIIYAILFANATVALLVLTSGWALTSDRIQGLLPAPLELGELPRIAIATFLLAADAFLLLGIHEILRARVRWLRAPGRLALSLLTVLAFDATAGVLVGLPGGPAGTYAGELVARLAAGSIHAAALAIWLDLDIHGDKIDTTEIRDPLSWFTHQQRLELLERDKERTEGNLRRLFDSNVVGMSIETHAGRIVSANDRFLEILGYRREDLPLPRRQLIPPERRDGDAQTAERALATGKAELWEEQLLHRDGHRVPVATAVVLMEGTEAASLSVVVDLTQIHEAKRALGASQQRYKALFDNIPLLYFTLDSRGVVRSVNSQGAAELGYEVGDLIGQPVAQLLHPADRDDALSGFDSTVADPQGVKRYESRKVRKDGTVLTTQETVRVIRTPDERTELLVVCEDITARKLAELTLAQQQAELRELADALATAEERERRRIGLEIHDGLGQNLAMAQLNLGRMQNGELDGETAALLAGTRELIVRTMRSARSLSFSLTSPVLYDLGLEAALQDLAARTAAESPLTVDFRTRGSVDEISDRRAAVLYRTTRELVRNAVRHARAQRLLIQLEGRPDRLSILVEDDGIGFEGAIDGHFLALDRGLGLRSVKLQLQRLGGTLEIQSRLGEGARMIIDLPLESTSPGEAGRSGNPSPSG